MSSSKELADSIQTAWHDFLEKYESLRPELYRYCRHLTRSPWDAEDLAQDTLARAFVTLAQLGDSVPANPRAWLFRVASNLWIDRLRRLRREEPLVAEPSDRGTEGDPQRTREAAGTLLGQLSPQERAAVVLKDVFDFSLEEVAESLSTTVGAVKSALSRARGKLVEPSVDETRSPRPAVLDAFCAAFNAGDIDGVTALLLDSASVEVVGATTRYGPEEARRTVLQGMLFGVKVMAEVFPGVLSVPPRVEAHAHRGGWVLVHFYAHHDGEKVRALTRVEADGDRVSRLWNYFYNPELIEEVCKELGIESCSNGHSWWRFDCR